MSGLRTVKKKLSRCEKYVADGVRATRAGEGADLSRLEVRFERDFAGPLRDVVTILRQGVQLPPRELVRLARLESWVSRSEGRPTVTEELAREAIAAGDPVAVEPAIDPAVLLELTQGPSFASTRTEVHRGQAQASAGEEDPGAR